MKQNEIRLQFMVEEHVSGIAALERICFSDPWAECSIRSELTNPLSLWLVALDRDAVIGYIGSQNVLGEADIMNVAVAPDYRRCGVATMLLNSLQESLREREVHSLSLEVRVSNEAAISLYERLGYVRVGKRPGYYHKPKEDAWILRKEWTV